MKPWNWIVERSSWVIISECQLEKLMQRHGTIGHDVGPASWLQESKKPRAQE